MTCSTWIVPGYPGPASGYDTCDKETSMASLMIFGAVGDLTGRYLLPSLARLAAAGSLPPDLHVRGVGREDLDTDQFRKHAEQRLDQHAADVPVDARRAVLDQLDYVVADVTDPAAVAASICGLPAPVAFYLALPPNLFGPTVTALAQAGLPADSRIVLEKPFGSDQSSARELNGLLAEVADEDSIFRVDHFLAKQTVQNVLGLRFANRIFEPLWNAQHIHSVDIVWDETLTLEGRASYYDRAGALRDMLQNHLLQLLCLVAMEPPHTLTARDLRDRKVDVLRAVRALTPDEVARYTTRARYTAGRIGDRAVPDYTAEPGVDPDQGDRDLRGHDLLDRQLAMGGRAVPAALWQSTRGRAQPHRRSFPGRTAPGLRATRGASIERAATHDRPRPHRAVDEPQRRRRSVRPRTSLP